MPSKRANEDHTSSFDSCKETLVRYLRAAQRRQSGASSRGGVPSSDPIQIPHETFEEHDRLVEGLVSQSEAWSSGLSVVSTDTHTLARDQIFRKIILGQRVLGSKRPQRSRVLATLLLCDLKEDSDTWRFFLGSLALEESPEPGPLLIDANLPLGDEEVESILGSEQAAKDFVEEQYSYCERIRLRFPDVRQEIVAILEKVYKTCAHESGNIQLEDGFFPDEDFYHTFDERKTLNLLANLYIETQKWLTQSQSQRHRYQIIQGAREQSANFLRGLLPRRKILAALLRSHVEVYSRAWHNFMKACLDHADMSSPFCDNDLPMDGVALERHFGEDNNKTFLRDLDAWQYCFCVVKLEKKEQLERRSDPKLHLPLLSSSLLGEGSMGQVYRVLVQGGYLESDDTVVAMKRMSIYDGDEWDKVSWMHKQPLSHDHIMKPRASIIIGDNTYLFYEEAKFGDLKRYFTRHFPKGPQNHDARMRLLDSMYLLAHAVEWLQYSVEKPIDEHKIRRIVCIHKDLKAENILVTEDHKFKITDFGISSYLVEKESGEHEQIYDRSKSLPLSKRCTKTSLKGLPHCPPEAEEDGKINTRGDVWSLGTVFVECVAWMSGGGPGFDEFRQALKGDRKWSYFDRSSDGTPSLKESVRRWFESLMNNARDTGAVSDALLYESCSRLLLENMLVCDPAKRSDIRTVTASLLKMKDEKPVNEIFPIEAAIITTNHQVQPKRSIDEHSLTAGDQPLQSGRHSSQENTQPVMLESSQEASPQPCVRPPQRREATARPRPPYGPGAEPSPSSPASPANSNTSDRLRLIEAVKKNDLHEVQSLIEAGVDVGAKDKHRWTALHHSVYEPHGIDDARDPLITRVLLEAKPSLVHEKNKKGETAMHLLAQYGSLHQAKELWRCPEKPDLQLQLYGLTLIALARERKQWEMVDWIAGREKELGSAAHVENV